MKERVVVAMSGGVDSAVAAALLVEAGHEVIGLSLRLASRPAPGGCCSLDDFHDAEATAAALGIRHYVLDFREAFEQRVVSPFVREYLSGRTPNPCVHCNTHLKFDALLARARALGAAKVATGHYARIERGPGGELRLRRGVDRDKDQSYFLFGLSRSALEAALFPVGELTKGQVRGLARRRGLPVADKAESQEICFVPPAGYAAFIEERVGPGAEGEIVDRRGGVLGRHNGVYRFTLGQRRGLGLRASRRLYVHAIDAARRRVVVDASGPPVARGLRVAGLNWISGPVGEGARVEVQLRHRHRPVPARIYPEDGSVVRVEFARPSLWVTPGQAAVFYHGEMVLGGGWIEEALGT